MSMNSSPHADHDPDALFATVWFGVALVVMVAFSYWLTS